MNLEKTSFRAYDIRGIYPEQVNEWLAEKIGNNVHRLGRIKRVLVAMDGRSSSKGLKEALVRGIRFRGIKVFDMGQCSTPKLYFATAFLGFSLGIMVTASHNPKDYNGFKFVGKGAVPISYKDGLKKIEKKIHNHLKIRQEKTDAIEINIEEEYKIFIQKHIEKWKKMKVVVDFSNGMCAHEAFAFEENVLDIKKINENIDGEFPGHEPNPLNKKNVENLSGRVKRERADLGIIFDGDGDRAVFVDENGDIIDSDLIFALLIEHYAKPGDTVVYDLRMSKIIEELCEEKNIKAIKSKVGHTFISKNMIKRNAALGGELSGHFYFSDNYHADSGILTAIKILNILSRQKQKFSELIKKYSKYKRSEELNFEVKDADDVFRAVKKLKGKKDSLDGVTLTAKDYWFNVRESNTENLIRLRAESNTEGKLDEIITMVGSIIKNS